MSAGNSRIAAPKMNYSITTHWTGANSSGLPVPTSAVAATTGAEGNKSPIQQERKIPSTVGSALRRRQLSNASQKVVASNNKSPSNNYSTLCTFRSSQQQQQQLQQQQQQQIKPPSMVRQSSSSLTYSSLSKLSRSTTTTTTTTTTSSSAKFKAHLRLTSPTISSSSNAIGRNQSAIAALKMRQHRQLQQVGNKVSNGAGNGSEIMCEDDDKMDDDVESLPPLKSTSYIGHISTTTACDNGAYNGLKQSQPVIKGGYRSSSSSVVSLASSQDLRSDPIISVTSSKTPAMIPTMSQRPNTSYGTNRITQAPVGQHLYQSAQSLAKPSQLVKPMLKRNTSTSSKFGLKKVTGPTTNNTTRQAAQQIPAAGRQVPGRQVSKSSGQSSAASRLSYSHLPQPGSVQGIRSGQSRLPTLPSKSLIGSLTSRANREAQSTHQPSSSDNRQLLSLKPSSNQPTRQSFVQPQQLNRQSLDKRNEAAQDHLADSYPVEDKLAEEIECDDFVDANDDSNASDEIGVSEEEELVTASHSSDVSDDTMQMANQELDHMIQMLTSSAIISNSDNRATSEAHRAATSVRAASETSARNMSKEASSDSGSHLDSTVLEDSESKNYHHPSEASAESPKEVSVSRKLSIKKRPSNIFRSQSTSLNKQQSLSTRHVSSVGPCSVSENKFGSVSGKVSNALPRRSVSIKSARPRSRIIFDPMKSEFHVSCTNDADSSDSNPDGEDTLPDVTAELNSSRKDDLTISSDGDNTSDDDGELPELTADVEETKTASNSCANNITIGSDSSMKLLEAQSRIMSLKSLPLVITRSNPTGAPARLDQTTEPVKRETPEESNPPSKSPTPKRCKSPVGSALRSLLGLGSSNNKQEASVSIRGTGNSNKKVATVMRHGSSLRVPMTTDGSASIPKSESARLKTTTSEKQSSDATEGNPSLIDYYNYGTIQQNSKSNFGPSFQNSHGNSLQQSTQIRPPSMIYGDLRHSPARSISSFKTKKLYEEECKSMYDNDVKCLPNLKSISYTSRISSPASGYKNGFTKQPSTNDYKSSEPIVKPASIATAPHRTVSCNRYQSPAHLLNKPSQLVRPILLKDPGSNQATRPGDMTKREEITSTNARKLSWPQQQQPIVYGLIQRQSRLPTLPTKNSMGSMRMPAPSPIAQRLHYNTRPQARQSIVPPIGITRRLDDIGKSDDIRSTSETSACSYSMPEDEPTNGLMEDFLDANESNGSDQTEEPSEEEDLMTGSLGSDSMKIANRELNDMIQMLTSSTITNKRDIRSEGRNQTPTCDTRKVTEILSSSGSHLDLLVQQDLSSQDHLDTNETSEEWAGQVGVSRKLSIRQRPDVFKSQSMSFNQQQGLSTSQASSVGLCSGSEDKFPSLSGKVRNALPRRSASIKSSRPRSRIIFDPIKSEFHVSCTTDADSGGSEQGDDNTVPEIAVDLNRVRKGSLTLDSDDSSASNDESNFQGYNLPDAASDMNNIDESSLKLLEAQSKIISLKHLPVARQVSDIGDMSHKPDSATAPLQAPAPCQLPPKCPPLPAPAKRCKSPVGSALRSLFGLKSSTSVTNKQQQQNTSQQQQLQRQQQTRIPVDTSTSTKKIATVMRHSSLRLDPRRQTIVFSNRGGIPSIQNNPTLKAAVPVPKSVSIDGGCAPLTSMDYCNQGDLLPQSQKQQHGSYSLGSDLLHRAGRRLSASSSSLTSRFKFIGSPSPSPSSNQQTPQTLAELRRSYEQQANK